MSRARTLARRGLPILLLLLLLGGFWMWQRFLWVFFVKPGPGGPHWQAPILAVAGSDQGESGFLDGRGTQARLAKPIRLARLDADRLVFADINNHAVRVLHRDGTVTTLGGGPDRKGHQDGPAAQARFSSPHGVAVRGDGAIAVAEVSNHTIRLLTPGPGGYVVTTLAGRPGSSGFGDGPAAQARFSSPHAVLWGPSGELYVADIGNARVRCLRDGQVRTVAGTGSRGEADGASGTLNWPMDLALDGAGGLWIADCGSLKIRRWQPGVGLETPFSGRLAMPHGIATTPGHLLVAEMNGQRILAFDRRTGAVSTLCGTTEKGCDDRRLNRPAALLVEGADLWIADLYNHRLVKVVLPVALQGQGGARPPVSGS